MEIIRTMVERRWRTGLTSGGIAVGALALTLAGAMAERFDARFQGEVAYHRANIQVTDSGTGGVISTSKIAAIQGVPGVAIALPTISIPARPGFVDGSPLAIPAVITYADPREGAYSHLPSALAGGRQLDPARQGDVVLGADLASALGARVGDTIDLPVRSANANPDFINHPFRVIGARKSTGTIPDTTASVGLLDAQTLLQESLPASFRDRIDPTSLATSITVYGKRGVDLDRLADQISSTVAGVAATRPSDFVRAIDQSAPFTTVAVVTALLVALVGGLLVTIAMRDGSGERDRETALKVALGARPWQVAAEHGLEALALAGAGGAAGLVIGIGVAWLLDLAGRSVGMDIFLVTGRSAAITLGLALAIGAAAGAAPALRAAELDASPLLAV